MTDGRRDTWRPNNPDTNDRALITEARLWTNLSGGPATRIIHDLADALEARINLDLKTRILISICLVEACAIAALVTIYMWVTR